VFAIESFIQKICFKTTVHPVTFLWVIE